MIDKYKQGVPQPDMSLWFLHFLFFFNFFTNIEAIRIGCFCDATISESC